MTYPWSLEHTLQTPAFKSFPEKKNDSKALCGLRARLHVCGHCVLEHENDLEYPLDQLHSLSVCFTDDKGAQVRETQQRRKIRMK